MTEPAIFPNNPVSRVSDFVRQHNQGARPNPPVPSLDVPAQHPNAESLITPEEIAEVMAPQIPRAFVESPPARPAEPLTVDSVVFEGEKTLLVMNDGARHEIPDPLRAQIAALVPQAWGVAMT